MNWFEQLEQKRKLLVGGVVILCLAMLILTARRNIFSFDAFWHLQAGIDWLQSGLSPWIDHFSFTFNGESIAGPAYIFQATLAWLVTLTGLEPGFQIYRFASFILVLSLFIVFLRSLRASVLVYCLVLPMVVVLLQFRSLARPELIGYGFTVIAVMLYYRAGDKLSVAGVLPMIGLIFVWANYHTPIIGYIIFFGYFIDIALLQFRERAPIAEWVKWLGWGLAILFVGFLKPDFQHALVGYLTFSPEWKGLIQEYESALYSFRYVAAFYALIAIALFTFFLLFWKRRYGLLVVCLILSYNAIFIGRLVTPAGLVVLCAFAWMFSSTNITSKIPKLSNLQLKISGSVALLIFVATLWTGVDYARKFMEENKFTAVRFPFGLVDYMLDNNIEGRIFNSYGIGGYLIYRLSPASKVYIDGRTNILYPLSHFYRFRDAGQSASTLQEEIDKYEINLAVLVNMHSNFLVMSDSGILGLDYVGPRYSLFRKENPNFPLIGSLLANPACWDSGMLQSLQAEQSKAREILPDYSPLLPFFDSVLAYSLADNKVGYLNNLPEDQQWSDYSLRFMANQALSNGLYSLAIEKFLQIEIWVFKDYLATALANVLLGDLIEAELVLDNGTKIQWPSMKFADLEVLSRLLGQIQQNGTLTRIDQDYLARLKEQTGMADLSITFSGSELKLFCPDTSLVLADKTSD